MRGQRILNWAILLNLATSLALGPSAQAADDKLSDRQVEVTCEKIMNAEWKSPVSPGTALSQKEAEQNPSPIAVSNAVSAQAATHCAARKTASRAQGANRATRTVWGAVALTCGVVCVSPVSLLGGSLGPGAKACLIAGIGGVTYEMATTKRLADAISVAGFNTSPETLLPMAISMGEKGLDKIGKNIQTFGKEAMKTLQGQKGANVRVVACSVFGYSTLQMLAKQKRGDEMARTETAETETLRGLFSNAQALSTNDNPPVQTDFGAPSGATASNPGLSQRAVFSAEGMAGLKACEAAQSGDTNKLIECAISGDPNLPKVVQSNEFQQAFKDTVGMSLGEFNKSGREITGSTLAGLGGSSSGAAGLAQALRDAESEVMGKDRALALSGGAASGGGAYRQSGAAAANSGAGGSGAADELGGLLGKLLGGASSGSATAPGAVGTLEFVTRQMEGRNPAAIPEDPRLSLFDRITYRYKTLSGRLQ